MLHFHSIILYACPSWYPMTIQEQQMKLERIENLALKIMDPQGTDYDDRVARSTLMPLCELLDQLHHRHHSQ